MKFDPKDAVIVIILDQIPWADMPMDLQSLMVEKTFLQVPRDGTQKQEFTFWDGVCSYIGNMTARVSSKHQHDAAVPPQPVNVSTVSQNVDGGQFPPSRRAGIGEDIHGEIMEQSGPG